MVLVAAVVAVVAAAGVWIAQGGLASTAAGSAPNDSASAPPVVPTTVATTDTSSRIVAATDTSSRIVAPPEKSRPSVPPAPDTRRPPTSNQTTRARLDQIKAAIAVPDVDPATGQTIIRNIHQLLPALTTSGDSVEATYYLIETNLILDRPGEACRLLKGVRNRARGTPFEGSIDRYLASADLGCDSR